MCANQPVDIVGMTFGAFDLCHQGHINLLTQAKSQCDRLIVCISSDDYIINNKGVAPLLTYQDRYYLVELTGLADEIEMQSVSGKKELIDQYNPDILFVGDDWNPLTYGGEGLCKVIYLPYTEGISTSWYRKHIRI